MDQVVMYTRVSTDEQKENGYSLQEQEKRIKQHCEKLDWKIVSHFQDDHSAKDFLRPQWKVLIYEIKSKRLKIDTIVVTKIDRFSRNAFETHDMINILAKYNIRVYSITENQYFDFKNAQNFFQQYFSAGLAQYENILRGENTKRGMRQAAREGRTIGKAPTGYLNDIINKTVIKDPETAPLIIKGFEILSLDIYPIEEVRRKLIKEGLRKCCKQTFLNIVKNPYYYGIIKIKSWEDEPEEEIIGTHSPLITKDLFDKVQKIISGKKKANLVKISRNEDFPLRGHLICNSCHGNLTGSPSTSRNGVKHYYYHCQKGCKTRFRADLAHSSFEDLLDGFKIKKDILNLYNIILEDIFNSNEKDRQKQIKQADDKIRQLRSKLESLQDKLLDDIIDKTEYNSIKLRIQKELEEWELKKQELSIDKSEFQKYINYGFPFLYNIKEYYKKCNVDVKQKICGSIFPEKIIFHKNKYRTASENDLLTLLTLNINKFGDFKNEKATPKNGLSTYAPPLGLEPRTL
ncbi:MAG TPA: recombinase family protein [Flavobacterium sp.]|uniref:recombinase family protein n=1 Tax=Flavobacterium sp. TaxID=239 RepID=UPI002B4B5C02|nr:recombinase family protein [Flavobacterium sp.]HLO73876.1 recombinase family protein [Flavobacterium sp.]